MTAWKYMFLLITISIFGHVVSEDRFECYHDNPNVPTVWILMDEKCIASVTELIHLKISNSIQYLALGAFLSRDSVNRLGFAKNFFDHADVSRDHAIKLIQYVIMRGKFTDPNILRLDYPPNATEWNSLDEAITQAVQIESVATTKYQDTIDICEKSTFEDYNIANWISEFFLGHQYGEEKYFVDLLSSLMKMKLKHQEFGEFLLDHQLRN